MNETAKNRDDVRIDTYIGDLGDGMKIAEDRQHDGYAAIISRAGTAEMIERVARIPVTAIQISIYDMLLAVRLAQSYTGRYAVVGFPMVTRCATILCDLLKYPADIFTINSEEDLGQYLENFKEQGFSLIVGDVVTVKHAKRHGFNTILVTSGKESVMAAIDQTVRLHSNIDKIQFYAQMYRQTLDQSEQTILIYGKEKDLLYMNASAGDDKYRRLSKDLSRYVTALKNKNEIRILKHIGQHHWNVFGRLSAIGDTQMAVFYCSLVVSIGKLEQGAFTYRNFDDTPLVNFETFYAESPLLRNTISNAKKFGEKAMPVLIHGKMGSGKDLIAYVTSSNSPLRDTPLVIVDCRFMTDQQWKIMFESPDSPLGYTNYTIYFKNMHFLTEKQAQSLEVYIDNTSAYKRNRLMFSYVPGHDPSFDEGSLLYYIHNKIGALPLDAPSLNDYSEDIPSLATLFMNELNVEFGKQVIGFESDAMEALQQFHWEFNIEQFRRVMRELIVLTDSNYVKMEIVRSVLKSQISQNPVSSLGLSLDGTLNDIVSNVIKEVLAQEGMNQSKAAKRLGISRSTMWRKLREH